MNGLVAIGIDLGGTNLRVAVVDRAGRILGRASDATDNTAGPDPIIEQMISLADRALQQTSLTRADLAGVGVGSPGPLSPREGRIIRCANLPAWRDVPLRDLLAGKLETRVWLENDANAAAFGEFWAGAGRDGKDMVMLTLGTGVGAGVIIGGSLLHGHFENAAELGHAIIELDGLPCPCGQWGCLEQYVSASGMARRAVAALSGRESEALSARIERGETVDASIVRAAAQEGDVVCSRIWNETCVYLAAACINVQHAYNPARIVLGGGLALAGDFLLAPVRAEFAKRQWKLHDDFPVIELAELGDDAGVIGAAGMVHQDAPYGYGSIFGPNSGP